MKITKLVPIFFLSFLFLASCDPDENPIQGPLGAYENGFFVLNEGHFGSGNASITYVSDDYAMVEQTVYKAVNGEALGDIAQSIFMHDDKAYIVLNGSDKIEVVNRYTMKKIATIQGSEIKNPRYMVEYNGFGYISNWGVGSDPSDDTVVIIDLTTDTIINTFAVGFVPNKMLVVENKLYIAIQGWSPDIQNKVELYDLTTNTKIKEFEVGDYPTSLALNIKDIYVLSGESWIGTGSTITKINTDSDAITKVINLPDGDFPSNLTLDIDTFYYSLRGKVFKWNGIDDVLPTTEEIGLDGLYKNMTIKEGLLYATSRDYSSEGNLKIYKLSDNSTVKTLATGIAPNGIGFN